MGIFKIDVDEFEWIGSVKDEFRLNGYVTFWNEWHRRRNENR